MRPNEECLARFIGLQFSIATAVGRVVGEIARVMKPGGIFFFDTINRTWRSKLLAIKAAQDWALTRVVPRNVHVWEKFVHP